MKCPNCGDNISIKDKICPECNKPTNFVQEEKSNSYWGYCCVCGISKAKNVKGDKERPEYWCYECWRANEDKKFHYAERLISPEELAYAEAKKIYILKPQFYGEKPDYDNFQKAADKYTAWELEQLKRAREAAKK